MNNVVIGGEYRVLTKSLANFVSDTKTENIPDEVLFRARDALIDTMGVGLAGLVEPVGQILMRWVKDTGARPQATVWGSSLATSPAEAAFVNGTFCHALDFDDSLPSLRGHVSGLMIPASLAVGEVVHASGPSVLAAFALGLEVAGKLGRALGPGHYLRGWHTTSTVGVFSSAAVAARLWSLDSSRIQHAWGIAASQAGGLIRNFGTMTKPFHTGHAARCGVLAAWLAREGLTADKTIFDGDGSFLSTYGDRDGESPADLAGQLGKPWEISQPGLYVKRWPCCYPAHRAIGGLLELLNRHQIRTEEINFIAVGFPPGADKPLVSTNPQSGLEGKFSIEYTLAAMALDRKLTIDSFTDPMVQRPEIRQLMAKVQRYRIPDDGKVYSGVVGYNDIAIDTSRGRFTIHVDRVPGSSALPMTVRDRREKFIDCAARVLGTCKAEQLLELAQQCEKLSDIRQLVRAMEVAESGAEYKSKLLSESE